MRELRARVAFNFDDFRARCDEYAEKVRAEARQIIAAARDEAATIRQQAAQEGQETGRQQGLAAARDEIEQKARELAETIAADRLQTALPALQAAVDAVLRERDHWLEQWEALALRLSAAIAAKLLKRELDIRPESAAPMLREVLALAAGSQKIRVRMNPRDAEHLGPHAAEAVRTLAACGEADLVYDPAITPGGCEIETQDGTIDARIETQLERMTAELL